MKLTNISHTAPVARARVDALAAPLKITPNERLQLSELIRKRKLEMSAEGHLPVDTIMSMLREIRGK